MFCSNRLTCGTIGYMNTTDTADTVSFTLRLPEELVVRIGVLAAKERKSRQRWIEEALRLVTERMEAKDAG